MPRSTRRTGIDCRIWSLPISPFISTGFDDWQKSLAEFFVGFPNGRHVIDDYVSEADSVVTRCRFQGTHTGIFHGIEPSGNRVSVGVIHIDRVENGIVVEHFGQLDGLGLMHQIGAF
jgi:predicted ester cyclase